MLKPSEILFQDTSAPSKMDCSQEPPDYLSHVYLHRMPECPHDMTAGFLRANDTREREHRKVTVAFIFHLRSHTPPHRPFSVGDTDKN